MYAYKLICCPLLPSVAGDETRVCVEFQGPWSNRFSIIFNFSIKIMKNYQTNTFAYLFPRKGTFIHWDAGDGGGGNESHKSQKYPFFSFGKCMSKNIFYTILYIYILIYFSHIYIYIYIYMNFWLIFNWF